MTTISSTIRAVERHADHRYDRREAISQADEIGKYMWDRGDREPLALLDLPGWPECECCGCGCTDPATTTDDSGTPVCNECAEYAVDDDGDVHCDKCGDIEIVTESCGAGGQTRSYARIIHPAMPEADHEGEWSLYWDTVGDDSRVIARFASRDDAEQAVAAKDWPSPGDHTQYLCGYVVRQLVDGEWVTAEDE